MRCGACLGAEAEEGGIGKVGERRVNREELGLHEEGLVRSEDVGLEREVEQAEEI